MATDEKIDALVFWVWFKSPSRSSAGTWRTCWGSSRETVPKGPAGESGRPVDPVATAR
jgi:hypothetical protein